MTYDKHPNEAEHNNDMRVTILYSTRINLVVMLASLEILNFTSYVIVEFNSFQYRYCRSSRVKSHVPDMDSTKFYRFVMLT